MKTEHRQSFRVRSYEVDQQGRLQPSVLCRLLQEAATVHAARLGVAVETLIDSGVAWVMTRLELEMLRWPGVDDVVTVCTWPEAMSRLTTERRFTIEDSNGSVLGSATTLWLVLDLARRRPVRIPGWIAEMRTEHDLGSQPLRPQDLELPESIDGEVAFTVRRRDLDSAGHVNNTSFVEWVVESASDDVWATHELEELEIGYRSECHLGQTIESRFLARASDNGGTEMLHQLVRQDDGDEVARARTLWKLP